MTKTRNLSDLLDANGDVKSASLDNVPAVDLTNLSATNLTSGTVADARLPATALNSNVDLTNLSASNLTSGTVATARLGTGTADATTFLRGDNTFNAPPLGGITVADQWRITADKGINNTANVFDANLEQVDGPAQGTLGTAMSVSSGVFTYPSTGTWLVMSNVLYTNSNTNPSTYVFTIHQNSTNGSNFTESSEAYTYFPSGVTGSSSTATGIDMVNVTNTSNVKTRFLGRSLEACVARGYSTINFTSFTFIRLGDST